MTGSDCGVFMVGFHQFVGRADDRRLVTGLTTHPFDPRAHGGICDVPEVPRYKVVGAVRNRDGNVSGIFRERRAGHRPAK